MKTILPGILAPPLIEGRTSHAHFLPWALVSFRVNGNPTTDTQNILSGPYYARGSIINPVVHEQAEELTSVAS